VFHLDITKKLKKNGQEFTVRTHPNLNQDLKRKVVAKVVKKPFLKPIKGTQSEGTNIIVVWI
tara:strand:+ start:1608 stop:1793 length:186 start_codon:yes stop_codon:yes gene_type:complete